jgi:hypothetical protein
VFIPAEGGIAGTSHAFRVVTPALAGQSSAGLLFLLAFSVCQSNLPLPL